MTGQRMLSGIPGLDQITKGGFFSRHTYVVVGSPGTGKTILSIQWLLDGQKWGEKGVFVSMVEEPEMIRQNLSGFGWDLDGIEFIDFSGKTLMEDLEFDEYHIFPPGEVEQVSVWKDICQVIDAKQPQRLVIDSITQLRQFSTDEFQFRKHIFSLIRFLKQKGCTTLFSCEPLAMEQDTAISSVVDGILYLKKEVSPERVIDLRSLHVDKFRGSDFISGLHPMRITSRGIEIFPHVIELSKEVPLAKEMFSSGIRGLDELLRGGLESGTTTIISGPSGTGKSSLAMQFLVQAARAGKKTILYAFEETAESILFRSRNLGMEVDSLLKNGMLNIKHINPLELYPDEFFQMIHDSVVRDRCEIKVFDSLKGYYLAMDQFGSPVAHLQNIIIYLKGKGTTVLMINETENITGDLRMTEAGISFMADNIILLRYIERSGKIARVIGCMKKRLGAPQAELREMLFSSKGIQVGEKLDNLVGVLTGTPVIRGRGAER